MAVATFVVAPPVVVAATVGEPGRWDAWWPDLELTVTEDRGVQGVRWVVAGAVSGSAELWLEPVLDGTVVHWFLRGEPASGSAARAERRYRRAWRSTVLGVKDALEADRPPGVKPVGVPAED